LISGWESGLGGCQCIARPTLHDFFDATVAGFREGDERDAVVT